MKGLTFQKQWEIRAEILGEEFRQGDTIRCLITVTNRSSNSRSTEGLTLELCTGDSKKVKAKADGAFSVIAAAPGMSSASLAPGESQHVSWGYQLDRNCRTTDKAHGLFLVYGVRPDALGHLEMPVLPHSDIEAIFGVFETSFQFALKGTRWKDEWLVAKFKAPDGKRYTTLDELALSTHFNGEGLDVRYAFKVKRLEATATELAVQKKAIEFQQEWKQSDFISRAGYVDPELLEPRIEEALQPVVSKFA